MRELSLEDTSLLPSTVRSRLVEPHELIAELAADGRPIACFLDFDGTLVDIVERYDEVVVPTEVAPLLARLSERLDGALAILSGRSFKDLDRYLNPLVLPGCGQHGLEMRLHGERVVAAGSALVLDDFRQTVCELPRRFSGLRIEDKGLTVALHYGDSLDAENELLALAEASAQGPLALRRGKRVIEIGLSGATKGAALAELMRGPPFAGRRPVMFGDDLTDEFAFREAHAHRGLAVAVGERVAASADVVLADPTAVRVVLSALAGHNEEE